MSELGRLFKKERESKKLEIELIAETTKISIPALQAIEAGDYDSLPAKVFTRGFVQSYAKYLELDVTEVMKMFDEEFSAIEQANAPEPEPVEAPTSESSEPQEVLWFQVPKTIFMLTGFAVATVLFVFIYITLQKIEKYSDEKVDSENPTEIAATAEAIPTDEARPKEKAPEVAPTEKAKPKKIEAKEVPPAVPVKKPVPAKVVKPVPAAKPVEKPVAAAKPVPVSKPKPTGKENVLVIEAYEPVRIEIFWSTGKPQVMLLKEDESKKIVFRQPVKILVSDGSVVSVTYNGKEKGIPGETRKPVELKYP